MERVKFESHTISNIKLQLVWITKKGYKILKEDIAERVREIIRSVCRRNKVEILNGEIEAHYIKLYISIPATLAPDKLIRYFKTETSRKLQREFFQLYHRYYGKSIWNYGYLCSSSGEISQEAVKKYIESYTNYANNDNFYIAGERQLQD